MKQVTLTFTPEEYMELAKIATIGSQIIFCQDDYPKMELTEEVVLKICKNGFDQIPESGAFLKGAVGTGIFKDPEFMISNELFDECELIEEDYKKQEFLEYLTCIMADRDFEEQYGKMDPDDIVKHPDLMQFVLNTQTEYRQEFMFNGVDNLRLIK